MTTVRGRVLFAATRNLLLACAIVMLSNAAFAHASRARLPVRTSPSRAEAKPVSRSEAATNAMTCLPGGFDPAETTQRKLLTPSTPSSRVREDAPPRSESGDGNFLAPEERDALDRINAYRHRLGLGALEPDRALGEVARAHSLDMARRRYFGHIDPDGGTPFDRLASSGCDVDDEGECLAAGYGDAARTVSQWRHSPPHDAALRDPAYRYIGIAHVTVRGTRFTHYWTALFVGEGPRRRLD